VAVVVRAQKVLLAVQAVAALTHEQALQELQIKATRVVTVQQMHHQPEPQAAAAAAAAELVRTVRALTMAETVVQVSHHL